ncbi:MAG TPA: hypothetical protein VK175_15885 [Leadbetterella sp.]|nr:hypothetical protein [Leadbetterella sp.]
MKYFPPILMCFLTSIGFAQNLEIINSKIDSLTNLKKKYEVEEAKVKIALFKKKVDSLEILEEKYSKILDQVRKDKLFATSELETSTSKVHNSNLSETKITFKKTITYFFEPTGFANIGFIKPGTEIFILDYIESNSYSKFFKVRFNNQIGYISTASFENTPNANLIDILSKTSNQSSSENKNLYVQPYSSTSIKSYYPSTSRESSSGKTIHTGPRGGRYYINSNGNKTYVKRK